MMKKPVLMSLLIGMIFVLMACQLVPNVTPVVKDLPTLAPVNTLMATAALPTVEIPTIVPTTNLPVPPAGSLPDYSSAAYLDDRSTPAALMLSYANGISRHEYIRAYSYWIDPAAALGTLDAFSNNYLNVSNVEVVFALINEDGAAGSLYYTVPVILKFTNLDSSVNKQAGCFVLRMPQPGNYGAPPITPLHIDRGTTQVIANAVSDSDGLTAACAGADFASGGTPTMSASVENLSDLGNTNYIDNRSGAVEVVSSLFNAINRKEYVRAYSYWENPASTLGNYDLYAAGFNDTNVITATFGAVTSDAGAGQIYYMVPVAEIVQTTSATVQTFVGCYTLHLSNPGMQGTPPFEPLGISQGHFTLVPNGTNTAPLLLTACN
jgi:hypothetical protein